MRIIETRRAPNPRRVGIFLAEKGLEVAREERDVMAERSESRRLFRAQSLAAGADPRARRRPGHRRIRRDLPLLRGSVSRAALFGTGSVGKAEVEMWNRRMEFGLFGAVASFFRHLHPKMAHLEVPQVDAWGLINRENSMLSWSGSIAGWLKVGLFQVPTIRSSTLRRLSPSIS